MENESTPIQTAVAHLRTNPHYQLLVKELENVKVNAETEIFDESTTDERRRQLVMKRNSIKAFIELPDDIVQDEEIKK